MVEIFVVIEQFLMLLMMLKDILFLQRRKYSVTRELCILTRNSSTVGLIIVKLARCFHNFCRGTFFINGNYSTMINYII